MNDPKAVERRRSSLYRMAGNIASGFLAHGEYNLDSIAEDSVVLAETIAGLIDAANPMPERERPVAMPVPR